MQVPFTIDVLWLTQYMIQRANERHMNYHEKWATYIEEWPNYELPVKAEYGGRKVTAHYDRLDEESTITQVAYDPSIPDTDDKPYDEQTPLEQADKYRRYSSYTLTPDLPKSECAMLTKLYSHVNQEDCQKVLDIYANRQNTNEIMIEPTDEMSDEFYQIIRDLYKEREAEILFQTIKDGDYDYSVLDLAEKKEYPTSMGSHWDTMSQIIKEKYQKEWQEVFALNDYEEENKWIYEHFAFVGKGEGYTTFRRDDSRLYGGIAATGTMVDGRTEDVEENKKLING